MLLRLLPAKKLSWLLLSSSAPLLLCSSALVYAATTHQIAQVSPSISRPTLRIGSEGNLVSELQAALKLLGFFSGTVDGVYKESTVIAVSRFQQSAGLNPDGVVGATTWAKLFPASPSNTAITPIATITASPTPSRTTTNNSSSNSTTNSNTPRPSRRQPANPAPASPTRTQTRTQRQQTNRQPATRNPAQRQSISSERPILRLGMRGSAVTQLQQRLQSLGLLQGAVDGNFGPTTEAAVKAAQQRFRLEQDGVVGPSTWDAIMQQRRRRRQNN